MDLQFQIESIFRLQAQNKIYVFAKQLNTDVNWELTETTKLGQVLIEQWLDIPRKLDKAGNIRLDVFTFALKNNEDENKLAVNQIVELIL